MIDPVYPPSVLDTELPTLMAKKRHTLGWLSQFLGVTPITAKRIMRGKDLKLTQALRLADHFKVPVGRMWRFPNES